MKIQIRNFKFLKLIKGKILNYNRFKVKNIIFLTKTGCSGNLINQGAEENVRH